LAVGITEPNPSFFRDGDVPEPFARWRKELLEIKPSIYRLAVSWAGLQPVEGGPLQADIPHNGCMREIGPCAGWNGLRDQLKALAQRQEDDPDAWQALVVPYGTPEWAAQGSTGCERSNTGPANRPLRPDAEPGYEDFVQKVIEIARDEGAELRYWSPWNEPNHPAFIAPQRPECSAKAPSAAVEPYARMARALGRALDDAPGDQELVLGELAGLVDKKSSYTSVSEFARALPKDVACSATIWGQHSYVGGDDPVEDIVAGLRTHACATTHEIWITETGVGGARTGADRERAGAGACRRLHRQLVRWYEDPRVTAAIQYTFREDDAFPVGLVTTDLTRSYATLQEWQAWGSARRPDPADPPPEPACGG
jgi:hypothetical protein